jgi:hypothetical protein
LSLLQHSFDVPPQTRLPPIVSGRFFSVAGLPVAGSFKKRAGSGCVEARVIALGQIETAAWPTALITILLHKSARHQLGYRPMQPHSATETRFPMR